MKMKLKYVFVVLVCWFQLLGVVGQVTPTSFSPANGATGVDANPQLLLTFPSNIAFTQTSTITQTVSYSITIWEYIGFGVTSTVAHSVHTNYIIYDEDEEDWTFDKSPNLNISGNQLIISLSAPLKPNQKYHVQITNGLIHGYSGITKANREIWNFTTAAPPQAVTATFAPTGTVGLAPKLTLTFSEAVTRGVGKAFRVFEVGNDASALRAYYSDGVGVTFGVQTAEVQVSGLEPNKSYYITVAPGFAKSATTSTEYAGITAPDVWLIHTPTAPVLAAVNPLSPANGATGVGISDVMRIILDRPVRLNSTNESKNIYIINNTTGQYFRSYVIIAGGTNYPSEITVLGNTISINDGSDLDYSSNYSVYIEAGAIESVADNMPFAGLLTIDSWRFTTNDAPGSKVVSALPLTTDIKASIKVPIVLQFDQVIYPVGVTAWTEDLLNGLFTINGQATGFVAKLSADNKTITINSDGYWPANTTMNIVMAPVRNISGQLSSTYNHSFKTDHFYRWTGITDLFGLATNWTPVDASLPISDALGGESFIVGHMASGVYPVVRSLNLSAHNLIMEPGSAGTLQPGSILTITNEILNIGNDAQGMGSLLNDGTVQLNGAANYRLLYLMEQGKQYYFSNPLGAITAQSFSGELWSYDLVNDSWNPFSGISGYPNGLGYIARSNAGVGISLSGIPYLGNNLTVNTVRNGKNFGWNLLGNPYNTAINFRTIHAASTNLKPHYYIRKPQANLWGIHNLVSGASTNLSENANPDLIPTMQAFWVQNEVGQNAGSFTFTRAARAHNVGFSYHKSAQLNPSWQVKLSGKMGTIEDETVVVFHPDAGMGTDAYDSDKRLTGGTGLLELYLLEGTTRLAISAHPQMEKDFTIPLGYYAKAAGTGTILLKYIQNLPEHYEVELIDLAENKTVYLKSQSSYSFVAAAGTVNNRFVLAFKYRIPTGVEEDEKVQAQISVFSHQAGSIQFKVGSLTNPRYEVLDFSGKIIAKGLLQRESLHTVTLPFQGICLVRVTAAEGIYVEKILVK